ncbi:MAG TPA: secretin and TonB N-terminal domain-containing protein [Candidatus Binatia bacterium]|jgi:type II secretory pathway component HofQ
MLIRVFLSTVRRFFQGHGFIGIVLIAAAAALSACVPAAMEEDAAGKRDSAQRQPAVPQPAVKEPSLQEQPFRLQDLAVQEERGQTTVRIKFSDAVNQYRHFSIAQPSRIVLDVFGPAKQLPQVETFRIETHWLSVLRVSSGEGHLRVVMEVAAATVPVYVIEPENGGLKLVIGPVNPQHTAKRDVYLVQNGRRVDISMAQGGAPVPRGQAAAAGRDLKGVKTYSGQKISLDFKDADIKNVFRLLAEVSGLNIVVTDEVKKRVTVRLVDVPWDQAMDLLIDTNGLGKEQMGNVVRISTAGQMKSERDALSAAQKAQENLEPLQTAYLNVNYAKVKELVDKIKPVLSPRGVVFPDDRSNTIVVRDIRKGIEDANEIASRLDTRTPQVLIESNLVEATPSFSRALGTTLKFARGAEINSPFAAGTPSSGIPFIKIFQNRFGAFRDLDFQLTAAEKSGDIRIISRPSVVTLNNVASTIQSLRVLRITLPSSTTNIASGTGAAAGSAAATEKIPVGVILSVTPQVSSDGFVLMSISVKSSSIAESPTVASVATGTGAASSVIPFDELTREAISNVLVRDGETIVIGGILKDTKLTSESGIPWLKDIPVFGWLFKNQRWQKDFEELIVFITPRIIAAGSVNLPSAEELWRDRLRQTEGG